MEVIPLMTDADSTTDEPQDWLRVQLLVSASLLVFSTIVMLIGFLVGIEQIQNTLNVGPDITLIPELDLGFTPQMFMALQAVLYTIVSLLLLRFIIRNPFAWFVSITILIVALGNTASFYAIVAKYPQVYLLVVPLGALVHSAMFILSLAAILLFPDGQFASRWTMWLLGIFALCQIAVSIHGVTTVFDTSIYSEIQFTSIRGVFFAIGVLALIYRFLQIKEDEVRRQFWWLFLAIGVYLLGYINSSFIVPALRPIMNGDDLALIKTVVPIAALLLPPIFVYQAVSTRPSVNQTV